MLIPPFVVSLLCIGVTVAGSGMTFAQTASTRSAQTYPNKPIRIVTSEVGGGNDFAARMIAQGLSANLGQPVIVENRGALMAPRVVVNALPDGYTLLVTASNFWIGPLLQKMPYDPAQDFSPISLTTTAPMLLVVHPSVAKSVKELIDIAKAKPGALNYATSDVGSTNHLAAELFKAMTDVNIVRVNYKGAGPALNVLVGGEVQMMFSATAGSLPHVKSGRLRALAVTSKQPSALLPGLPTMSATVSGYDFVTSYAIFGPAKTPAAIINRLNREVVSVLNQADTKERFFNIGVEIAGSSPEQLAAAIKSETTKLGKVIKDAGIRID